MIFKTIDTKGNEQIINKEFITHITITTVGNPTGHPCCGEKGDTMLRISIAHSSNWIQVVCDHDGDDVTDKVLDCYMSWGYRGTSARGE